MRLQDVAETMLVDGRRDEGRGASLTLSKVLKFLQWGKRQNMVVTQGRATKDPPDLSR